MRADLQMIGILPPEERNRKKFNALFQYHDIKFSDMKRYVSDETFANLMEFFKKCESEGYMSIKPDGIELSLEIGRAHV